MSLHCRDRGRRAAAVAWVLATLAGAAAGSPDEPAPLRVCADPDNLPYSKADGSGFENRIAVLLADALHRPLQTHWLPQRRGFVRKTIGAGACDLMPGVPVEMERLMTTRPYYRSGYVFVTREDGPPLASFDDPRLPSLRIGVQLVGDDLAATPPGHALARHGAIEHVTGYLVEGDGPAAQRMVGDVAAGRLDAAVVWGPQAGYFAQRSSVPLRLTPASAPADVPAPFEFAIAMGVRPGDRALRDAVDGALDQHRGEIDRLLAEYGVPRSDVGARQP